MAKLMRLVGAFGMVESMENHREWVVRVELERTEYKYHETGSMKLYITLGALQEELGQVSQDLCSLKCINFILYPLNLNYKERPTAPEALGHPFVRLAW